ncbi:MAG: pirin family protein [Leptolyngbya sp. PLA1]|nr:pirin family protein [Leptolyngbya sp. PLA1]
MLTLRPDQQRGFCDFGWLQARHSFSFGSYNDPAHMGYRTLRVINEDRVAPGQGFDTHPHRNMEIITYVVEGRLAHKDSTGGAGEIRPGQVQWMSAGSGVHHSEFNPDPARPLHLLQIWILPDKSGYAPAYDQLNLPAGNGLHVAASPHGRDGGVPIRQDATLLVGRLGAGQAEERALATGRGAWVQLIRGELSVLGRTLLPGDGAAIEDEHVVRLRAGATAEFLYFDLA